MLFNRALASVLSLLLTGATYSANLLETVKHKKEIVIGTEAQFTPFEYLQDGKIVGYGPDLMHLILADLADVKVKQFDVPFQGILPGLATKRFDFVVTSVTITKERADKFAFTVPIADATTALVKRRQDTALTDPAGIAGRTVGSQTGSAQLRALQDYAKQLQADGKPTVTVREYVSFDEAYADLAAGRLAAVAQSLPNLATLVKTRADVYALIPAPIGPRTYFGWVGRKDAESAPLVKFFSDGIARARKDGQIKALQMKWFGFVMDIPTDAVPAPRM